MLGKNAHGELGMEVIRMEADVEGQTITMEVTVDINTIDLLAAWDLFIREVLCRRPRGALEYVYDDEL